MQASIVHLAVLVTVPEPQGAAGQRRHRQVQSRKMGTASRRRCSQISHGGGRSLPAVIHHPLGYGELRIEIINVGPIILPRINPAAIPER
jgi:hypothetical protein